MAAHTAPKGRAGIWGEKSMAELVMMQKCSPVFMYSLSYPLVSTRITKTIKYLFNCNIPLTPKVFFKMSNTPSNCCCLVFKNETSVLVYWHWVANFLLCNWQIWCSQCCLQSICRTNDASKVEGATSHHWQLVGDLWHHCNRQALASHCWPKLHGHTSARSAQMSQLTHENVSRLTACPPPARVPPSWVHAAPAALAVPCKPFIPGGKTAEAFPENDDTLTESNV